MIIMESEVVKMKNRESWSVRKQEGQGRSSEFGGIYKKGVKMSKKLNAIAGILIFVVMSASALGGRIVALGDNSYGQCLVPRGDDYTVVSAGGHFGMALRENGSIVAWGDNSYGQCDVPEGNDFVSISAGGNHGIAQKSDGSLVAWGGNYAGQCDVPEGNDFVKISAGWAYNVAIRGDGTLIAWGHNGLQQCNVPGGNDYVEVAGGGYHGIALRSDGTIVYWGYHDGWWSGVPSGGDFVDISATADGYLGLKSDGSIRQWVVYNQYMGLPPSGTGFVHIAAGASFGAAIREDGSLAMWSVLGSLAYNTPRGNDFVDVSGGYEFCLALTGGGAKVYHVDGDAARIGDGLSWENAFSSLQSALDISLMGDEIRVANGIYRPDEGPGRTPGDRAATFYLPNGVKIKGGYAGYGETEPDLRDTEEYETVLNGDLGSARSFHVVTCDTVQKTTLLDGFTISRGRATGAKGDGHGGGILCKYSPCVISNCVICDNTATYGGGLYIHVTSGLSSSDPTVTNCIIEDNLAYIDGGGICNGNGNTGPIANCLIIGNHAGGRGGGVFSVNHSSPILTNCVVRGNSAGGEGGAICQNWSADTKAFNCTFLQNNGGKGNTFGQAGTAEDATFEMRNCIVWDEGDIIWDNGCCVIDIRYSDVRGGWEGEGNIDVEPPFVDPQSGDYHLRAGSACIDAGDPNYVWDGNEVDLDGRARVFNGRVDMGAYEFVMLEADVLVVPAVLNRRAKGPKEILAFVYLGEQCAGGEVEEMKLYPGGVEAAGWAVIERADGRYKGVTIAVRFAREEVLGAISGNGETEVEIVGHLNTGEWFSGADVLRIR